MTNQELCTQYQLMVALLKRGDTETVIKILETAINRIDKGAVTNEQKQDNDSN